MIRSESLTAVIATPAAILAVLGWVVTTVVLALYSPLFASGALVIGLVFWYFNLYFGAVGLTQVAVGVLAPDATLGTLVFLELGPTLLILGILTEQGLSIRTLLMWIGFILLFGMVAMAGVVWGGSLRVASGTLLLIAGLTSYTLHRYELVTLGLVDGEST